MSYWEITSDSAPNTWSVSEAAVNATIEELKFDLKTIKEESGEVEYEVRLPITLPNLRRVPAIREAQRIAKAVGWLRQLRQRVSGDSALEFMSRYRSILARVSKGIRDDEEYDPVRVKPAGPAIAGTAYALLAGGRHVVTFDNVPFDFDGGCRYVLSRYTHDAQAESALDFTVTVDYALAAGSGAVAGRSVSIGVGGKTVTLQSNLVVQLDHADVALPLVLENENVQVERRGAHVQASLLNGAFVVKCYAPHQVCEFIASRHLHGKLVGLLGNMNGEAADDGLTPDGQEVSSVSDLAKAWHVEAGCTLEATPRAEPAAELPANSTGAVVCNEAFESGRSTLAACFARVNKERYASSCVRDVALDGRNEPDTERRVACRVAAMYLHECQLHNVPSVALPASCSRCELQLGGASHAIPVGRELLAHSASFDLARVDMGPPGALLSAKPEIGTTSADVVLVVEEDAGCVPNFASLNALVDSIEAALVASQSTENRYALVGATRFGVKGQHMHAGKAGSELVTSAELKQMLGAIHVPTNVPKMDERWLTGATQKGLLGAVRQALTLFSRPSVIRQVVLVRCTTCAWSAQDTEDLSDLLRRAGAQLNLVTPFANAAASTPFGFDLSLSTAPAGSQWGARSANTFPAITGGGRMRDSCLSLVSNERGLIVDLRRINANAFASAIVRRANEAGRSACRKCQCLADTEDGGSGLLLRCNACAERSAFFVRPLYKLLRLRVQYIYSIELYTAYSSTAAL